MLPADRQQDSPVSDAFRQPSQGKQVRQLAPDPHFLPTLTDDDPAAHRLRHIPSSLFRLQLNRDFTFQQARLLVPYLYQLGIGDCYASPIFKTHPGSLHGYDICDHTQLNPEVGTEEEFNSFSDELQARGTGLVLDIVPNHMSIAEDCNAWWLDVLENGPASQYASYFDIEWRPVKAELENKVLLPILEDQYGTVLERGKLQLIYNQGAFFLCYNDTRLPLTTRSYARILGHQLEQRAQQMPEESIHLQELRSILTALSYLPERTESSPERIAERRREKEVIKRRIAALYDACSNIRTAIHDTLQTFNGIEGDAHSFDGLHELMEAQPYRLSYWRVATEEINYRRFFDINELAAIRVELPQVFDETHQLVFRFLREGRVTGLRIDHPDGLLDSAAYFQRLQKSCLLATNQSEFSQKLKPLAASVDSSVIGSVTCNNDAALRQEKPLYVVAEKILAEGEPLPADWAIHGTTGYDFLRDVNGLFVDSANAKTLNSIYSQFTGAQTNFRDLVNSTKKMTMLITMAGEINALSHRLERISEKNRRYRDFTLNSLTHAIREVIACLPVYRTYIVEEKPVSEKDKAYIEVAIAEARSRNPRTPRAIFDFIRNTLLLNNLEDFRPEDRPDLVSFVMRFQQITGSVMAKGLEDTAFYVYNRFISLNEVGGNPERFGIAPAVFHSHNLERQRRWPHSLLTTSTHDTKRSEDVRARLNVLSEIPKEWRAAVIRWSRLNAPHKTRINGTLAPDANDEYFLYQTLIGAWQSSESEHNSFLDRIVSHMRKATREAKVHTSWINPNEAYDNAVENFVSAVLDPRNSTFVMDFQPLQAQVAHYGYLNSLAQTMLKLTCPGVPDIYQGNELWDYSLVDPDNRRPVDYASRMRLLQSFSDKLNESQHNLADFARELLNSMPDGRVKLYLTAKILNFRRNHRALFAYGNYEALQVSGRHSDHVVAFRRSLEKSVILVVVPRLLVTLVGGGESSLPIGTEVWDDTGIAWGDEESIYQNVLTGELTAVAKRADGAFLPLASILHSFPVAFLTRI